MKKTFYIQKYVFWEQTPDQESPDISFIPALIRRRLTQLEKIGIYLAHQFQYTSDTKIVFASQFGEWQQTIKLIQQMHDTSEMSPAGFSHSVHNAMPGILSVIEKTTNNYTTIAANEETLDNALVECLTSSTDTLLIYVEESVPDFYKPKFVHPFLGHGLAILFSQKGGSDSFKIEAKFQIHDKTTTESQLKEFLTNKTKLTTKYMELKG